MRAFLFIGLCLALTACFDKGDCLYTNTTEFKIKLIKAEKRTVADTVIFSLIATPGLGAWTDADGDTLSIFGGLRVDPTMTQMTYVFQYESRSDTLVLNYTNQTVVLSPDCGSYIFQKDLTIERSTFGEGNVIIIDPRLLISVPTNIEIYL